MFKLHCTIFCPYVLLRHALPAEQVQAAAQEQAGPSGSNSAPETNGHASSSLKISDEDQQQLFDDDDDDEDLDDDDDGDMSDDELDQLEASINKSSLH